MLNNTPEKIFEAINTHKQRKDLQRQEVSPALRKFAKGTGSYFATYKPKGAFSKIVEFRSMNLEAIQIRI
jgi:hypothetical protein